jgi:uncharacterized protein (TIGR03437 family)
VDAAGNLYIADTATHRIRRVTPDGIIRTIAGSDTPGLAGDGGPALQAQLYNPRTLIFDAAGNLLIADSAGNVVRRITPAGIIERFAGMGQAASNGDGGPATAAAIQAPWSLAIDPAGRVLIGEGGRGGLVRAVDAAGVIRFVTSGLAIGLAADSAGRIWMAGAGNVTVATQSGLPFPLAPVISDGGITGGAMMQTGVVSPGEIVSIFGERLGPPIGMSGSISNGVLATTLAGTRVLFDGVASPLLFVRDSQINAVVPFAVAGKAMVQAVVEAAGVRSNPVTLGVLPAAPQLCLASLGTLNGAAALNQDGTPNRPSNEAAAGTVVSLFGAGAGAMQPQPADGQIITGDLPLPILPVRASIGARMLEVTYAGAAPGLVAGALQVNVRLPDDLLTGYYAIELRVGDAISGSALVFTKTRQ